MKPRICLLIPHTDYTTEPEVYRAVPNVNFHFVRMKLKRVTEEGLILMSQELEKALDLVPEGMELVVYHCTSGSFVLSSEQEREIVGRIEDSGVKSFTTSMAVIEALRAVGIRRVAIASPYIDDLNVLLSRYVESSGIEVVNIEGLGLTDSKEIADYGLGKLFDFAKRADRAGAEGLFISCTGLRTLGIIKQLEDGLKKPVISSNSATLWKILKECSMCGVAGYGTLLSDYLPYTPPYSNSYHSPNL